MLKFENRLNLLDSTFGEAKCGEIYIQNGLNTLFYNILCTFCENKIINYSDFLQHFEQQHIDEIKELLKADQEPITNVGHPTVDPLKLVKGRNNKNLETYQSSIKTELQNNNDCLGKIKMEEDVDVINGEMLPLEGKPREHPELQGAKPLPQSGNFDDYEEKQDDPEIDWSKPYQPALLKTSEKRPYKPRNKPNACHYCGRIFNRRYQLDTHLNIHTGLKPHQCEICGKQFRAITTLIRHRNTHADRQLYSCQFCQKTFTHKAALLSHETRHYQERNVECDECNKRFYTFNQLDTHKRKVHHKNDDTTLPFACNLCHNRYRSASMLSTHKFRKHYKTAKFSCDQCGKKFVNENQKNVHIKNIHFEHSCSDNSTTSALVI